MSFSDPAVVARYAENLARQVPGVHALHRMAHVLLAERVPPHGRVLVLGAGVAYDIIGAGYAQWRRPDRRIAAGIREALGTSQRVLNFSAVSGLAQ